MLADRMMAYALEARRWVEVFSQHGVRLVPHNVSDLRMKATDEGLTIRTLQGKGVLAPRLCVCCVYERHMPAALEQDEELHLAFEYDDTHGGGVAMVVTYPKKRVDPLDEADEFTLTLIQHACEDLLWSCADGVSVMS